jgi:serine/threonine-protein kinase RIM15
LRCRTISVPNGSEAVRYSMSEIKFDVIFLEYRLPQINGADVARMIRETKNANSHTPIVAITAYLKELQAPHYFDSLIEKPISSSKLTEVLRSLCQWRPESPGQVSTSAVAAPPQHPTPSGLRRSNGRADESPTSTSSLFAGRQASSILSSREDSITSSVFGDSESVTTDEIPVVISRKATGDWDEAGLGISEPEAAVGLEGSPRQIPHLITQQSAPPQLEQSPAFLDKLKNKRQPGERRPSESTESADDEDDELGLGREKQLRRRSKPPMGKSSLPSSKLGIEMMRANSHDSVTVSSESTAEVVTQVVTTPAREHDAYIFGEADPAQARTPPDGSTGSRSKADGPLSVEATPRPQGPSRDDSERSVSEEEATPRPTEKF